MSDFDVKEKRFEEDIEALIVCMPILHRYADYLTRIFTDSVFIQSFYTRCFQKDMVERR